MQTFPTAREELLLSPSCGRAASSSVCFLEQTVSTVESSAKTERRRDNFCN
jgi:hypothetical protein